MADVPEWAREAAKHIEALALAGDISDETFARIIADAFAPHDVHGLLLRLSQDAKTSVMLLTPTPEGRKWICHPFGYADGKGDTIPAAVQAAREAMK